MKVGDKIYIRGIVERVPEDSERMLKVVTEDTRTPVWVTEDEVIMRPKSEKKRKAQLDISPDVEEWVMKNPVTAAGCLLKGYLDWVEMQADLGLVDLREGVIDGTDLCGEA